jgi:predicted ATPase
VVERRILQLAYQRVVGNKGAFARDAGRIRSSSIGSTMTWAEEPLAARAKAAARFSGRPETRTPSLLTVVTREQPRVAEICRRCEIGTRLEI